MQKLINFLKLIHYTHQMEHLRHKAQQINLQSNQIHDILTQFYPFTNQKLDADGNRLLYQLALEAKSHFLKIHLITMEKLHIDHKARIIINKLEHHGS